MSLFKSKIFLICCFVLLSLFFVFLFFQNKNSSLKNSSNIEVGEQEIIYESLPENYQPPIFSLHHISSAPTGASKNIASLYLSPEEFEKILISLKDSGYKTVFVSEIVDLLVKGQKPPNDWVAITFDDGNIDFYNSAFPLLEKYNAKTSLYIMTGVRGENYMSAEQIREVDASGLVEIGSHTVFHSNLIKISSAKKEEELKNSRKYLEDLLDKSVFGLAYPLGNYDEETKDLASQSGYKYGLTYNHRSKKSEVDFFEINRFGVWPGMNVVKFLENLQK